MDPNLIALVIYLLSLISITVYHLSGPNWPRITEKEEGPRDIPRLLQENPCQLVSFQKLVTPGRSVCVTSQKTKLGNRSPAETLGEVQADEADELICVVEQQLQDLGANAVALVDQRAKGLQERLVSTWNSSEDNLSTSPVFWLVILVLAGFLVLRSSNPRYIPSCPSCCNKSAGERKVVYLESVHTQTGRPRRKSSSTQTEAVPERISRSSQTEGPLTNPVRESLQLLEI